VKYPGQVIEVALTKAEAIEAKKSMIKSIYSRLFDYIVERINIEMAGDSQD